MSPAQRPDTYWDSVPVSFCSLLLAKQFGSMVSSASAFLI